MLHPLALAEDECLSLGRPLWEAVDHTPSVEAPDHYADPLEALLAHAIETGGAVLRRLVQGAVARLLSRGARAAQSADALLSDEEQDELAAELAAVLAAGDALARDRVRDHVRQALERHGITEALAVPVQRQSTDYSCGAACLAAVLAYHGLPASEVQAGRAADTSSLTGTQPEDLVRVCQALGLSVTVLDGAGLDDLARCVARGRPCLCCCQMWGGGHWVVVCGVGPDGVRLMDPSAGEVTLPADEWDRIWWDTAGGRRYDHYAIAVGPLARLTEAAGPTLEPAAALDYFRGLAPDLGTDPGRIPPDLRRKAFTLAAATGEELLQKVQAAIADRIQSGEVTTGPKAVQALLDAAGVAPGHPEGRDGYAATVFRTNTMDAWNQGLQDELAQQQETFPVWRYSNPHDSRSRPEHAARNGRYYPASVTFNQIRGTGIEEVANCRCTAVPIDRWQWADLKAKGARLADGYHEPAPVTRAAPPTPVPAAPTAPAALAVPAQSPTAPPALATVDVQALRQHLETTDEESVDVAPFFRQAVMGNPAQALGRKNELRTVSLDQLIPTQPEVGTAGVRKYATNPDSKQASRPLKVIDYEGRLYVEDGHHRLVAAAARGDTEVLARVYPGQPRPQLTLPWEQPLGQYLATKTDRLEVWKAEHFRSVRDALERGDPVSDEVLADYPDLRTRHRGLVPAVPAPPRGLASASAAPPVPAAEPDLLPRVPLSPAPIQPPAPSPLPPVPPPPPTKRGWKDFFRRLFDR